MRVDSNGLPQSYSKQVTRVFRTVACVRAVLEGRKEEAENILDLAKSRLATPDISSLVAETRLLIETISNDLARARGGSGGEPAEKPPRPAGAAKKQAGTSPRPAAAKKQAARKPPSKSPASAAS